MRQRCHLTVTESVFLLKIPPKRGSRFLFLGKNRLENIPNGFLLPFYWGGSALALFEPFVSFYFSIKINIKPYQVLVCSIKQHSPGDQSESASFDCLLKLFTIFGSTDVPRIDYFRPGYLDGAKYPDTLDNRVKFYEADIAKLPWSIPCTASHLWWMLSRLEIGCTWFL